MDKLVLMVEVRMTLVIIFGSEKVLRYWLVISEEIFHIWWIISSILIWLSKTDLFLNIILNNWLIGFLKPIAKKKEQNSFDDEKRKIKD